MERSAPDHRCIAVDVRGFGRSDAPVRGEFELADAAEDVLALVSALRVDSYVLIGHSMGGKIACAIAATQPSGLKALVLVAPSPPTPEPMDDAQRNELLGSYGNRAAAVATIEKITLRRLSEPLFTTCLEDNLASSRSGWIWWLEDGSREDISLQMASIRVPTLVLASSEDPAIAKAVLDEGLMPRLQHAQMKIVTEAGHLLPLEAVDEVGAAIKTFVGGLRLSKQAQEGRANRALRE
jgi:pimeloyl-ACP methyl ester carboxylesterase